MRLRQLSSEDHQSVSGVWEGSPLPAVPCSPLAVVLEEEEDEPDDGKNSFAEEEFDDDATGDYVKMVIAKYLQPGDDENLKKALDIIIRESKASTSYLQRRMGIGYNKAAEIIDKLEQRGIVSAPLPGGQKRDILVFDELGKPD